MLSAMRVGHGMELFCAGHRTVRCAFLAATLIVGVACSSGPRQPSPPSSAGGAGETEAGGTVGLGGASATGGAGGVAGGAGSVAGIGGAGPGFTLSATTLNFVSNCAFTAQTLTITNISGAPLSWTATGDFVTATLSPHGSTLAPAESIDVRVDPQYHPTSFLSSIVNINADGWPSQSVQIGDQINGQYASGLPNDIDFGDVPIGTSATAFVSVVGNITGAEILSSGNPVFQLSGLSPTLQPAGVGWALTFTPSTVGAQATSLIYGTEFGPTVCAPNSIQASGVGVLANPSAPANPTFLR